MKRIAGKLFHFILAASVFLVSCSDDDPAPVMAFLPMMQALGKGPIDVKGHRILRQAVDPRPDWMADMPVELETVYPQLAVAIGGAAETMPETLTAPPVFGGGGARHHGYVAGNLRITGS